MEPLSGSGAHWRQHSARTSEHHRLVSPNSINIRKQGSFTERDTRAGCPTAAAVLERARRDYQSARETTLRKRQRFIFDHCRVERRSGRNGRRLRRRPELSRSSTGQPGRGTPLLRRPHPTGGASTERTLAVGTTGRRSLLGRQRPLHDRFATHGILRSSYGQRSWHRLQLC